MLIKDIIGTDLDAKSDFFMESSSFLINSWSAANPLRLANVDAAC